ncbi:peptide ABC transporter ATP-binding protein, partial [Mesorhizobium sp. M00.F.Ca.ET.186.01.1.1]
PYTRELLSAMPIADPDTAEGTERIHLQGDVPSPLNPPSGCAFRTRCPHALHRCAEEKPALKDSGNGHLVACHLLD